MQDETKSLAEKYLGAEIPQGLYEAEKAAADRKLDWIIAREGDAEGERRKPYYLAQLIAELVRGDILTYQCMMAYEDKKELPTRQRATPFNQPHCSTAHPHKSRINCYGG